jgi:hypothetical protein
MRVLDKHITCEFHPRFQSSCKEPACCRDAWFEVPLPFFLRDAAVGLGWSRTFTGLFLALFIIVYGQFQSWSPQLVLGPLQQAPANKYVALLWAGILLLIPSALGPTILTADAFSNRDVNAMTAIMVVRIHQPFAAAQSPAKRKQAARSLRRMHTQQVQG